MIDDLKHELNITNYALTLACEHIAKQNPLLFSIVGKGLIAALEYHFTTKAKTELEVKRMTEEQKNE